MNEDELEVIRGTGNIYADVGDPDADTKQVKAYLAAKIIETLDRRKLTARAAAGVTGVTPADISRVRNADLKRFTIDRLIRILTQLDRKVEVRVKKATRRAAA